MATARASGRATASVMVCSACGACAMAAPSWPHAVMRQPLSCCWCMGHEPFFVTQQGAVAQARAVAHASASPSTGVSSRTKMRTRVIVRSSAIQRLDVLGEDGIEESAGAAGAKSLHDLRAFHPELVEDTSCHERGAVEAHAAVRQHAVPAADQMRAE